MITDVYDCHTQFEDVAAKGCGEWELERASEIADEYGISASAIVAEIEKLCRSKK